MKPMITRAWDGVVALLDTPTVDGRFLLAPPDGEQWWKIPTPLYTAQQAYCGHINVHHVGEIEHLERRGNELHGRGWVCTLHEAFGSVAPVFWVGVEIVPGPTATAGEWKLTRAFLHPHEELAAWKQAKIRHYPQERGPVRKICEESEHITPDGHAFPRLGDGWGPPDPEAWM